MQTLQQRQIDLSIIIPVYNLEHYLDPMLRSLAEQDLAGYTIEIIFVLNNCTDRSEDVIRNSGLDSTILNCATQGCGPARNMGLDVAVGKYIWMMDGDDWLLTDNAIHIALDTATACDFDILRIPFESDRFCHGYFSMVWQYLFKSRYISEFRFPAIQPCEDDAFMQQVLDKAGYDNDTYWLLPCLNQPLYYYNYMREGSNMYRVIVLGERI